MDNIEDLKKEIDRIKTLMIAFIICFSLSIICLIIIFITKTQTKSNLLLDGISAGVSFIGLCITIPLFICKKKTLKNNNDTKEDD